MKTGRRNFIKNSALLGTGLAIGFSINKVSGLFNARETVFESELTPFVLIRTDGSVVLFNPNPDMGQGATQAIPALIAEELEVDLDAVTIMQSDGNSKYGTQISGGSGSVRRGWEVLRKAGAAAKEMLVKAASQKWGMSVSDCYAEQGKVFDRTNNRSLAYGNLVELASTYEIPQNPILKQKKDFRIIGKMNRRPDLPTRVTGKAVYGIDIEVTDMLYAVVMHPPSVTTRIVSIDDHDARKVEGIVDIFPCERPMPHRKTDAVAVVAKSYWAALAARKVLRVTWDDPADGLNTKVYFDQMYEAAKDRGLIHEEKGNFDQHFSHAEHKVDVIYETPFLAHAPLEPECATVDVKNDGSVEVWAPVQGPDWARGDIAKYLGIVPEKIKMHVTLLGGSFGRKAYHDFLLEACFISRKVKRPVKLIWQREDDISQGPFRAGMLSHLQGTLKNGAITGFHHHAVGESIDGQVNNSLKEGVADPVLCGEMDLKNNQYLFESAKISYSRVTTEIPIVWWRSVYASNLAWGQECFIDELAHGAQIDPLQARLELLGDNRFKNVLHVLAEKCNYSRDRNGERAMGIAIWKSFESICASAVTVERIEGTVRISKVVSVIDCGIYINSDNVKAQTEGNIIMGLTAATKGGITFTNGKCDQSNFHQYQIMRMSEVPAMEVHIIESDEKPGGVGEPGLPPIAPALGNAIFNLTGKRIRKLPIDITSL